MSEDMAPVERTAAGDKVPKEAPPLEIFDPLGTYVRIKNRKRRKKRREEAQQGG